MSANPPPAAPASLLNRVATVARAEGVRGLLDRIAARLPHASHLDLSIMSFRVGSSTVDPGFLRVLKRARSVTSKLEFQEINEADKDAIEELTTIDPWKVPIDVSYAQLRAGCRCYVSKLDGRIVASSWMTLGPKVDDDYLGRSFIVGDDEVYHWRAFCVPDLRGKCVAPWHYDRVVNHVTSTTGRRKHLAFVRANNQAQLRSMEKTGWDLIGRTGFVQFYRYRLHYLWGDALKGTRPRFLFLQKRPQ